VTLDRTTREFRRLVVVGGAALAALLLGLVVASAAPGQEAAQSGTEVPGATQAPVEESTPIPVATPTPVTAAPAALMANVVAALQGCAKTTNSEPVNCPQRSQGGPQTGVTWELHGDPTQGAVIVPATGNQPTSVVGHYVMVARWFEQGHTQATVEVDTGLYEAPLTSGGGVGPFAQSPSVNPQDLPALPADSRVTRDAGLAMVRQTLGACNAATIQDWPSLCPGPASSFASYNQPTDRVDLRSIVNGDLSSNASLAFDSATGLSVLTGSYDLTASWKGPRPGSKRMAGNYKADLVWDQDHLSLLAVDYQ